MSNQSRLSLLMPCRSHKHSAERSQLYAAEIRVITGARGPALELRMALRLHTAPASDFGTEEPLGPYLVRE